MTTQSHRAQLKPLALTEGDQLVDTTLTKKQIYSQYEIEHSWTELAYN